MASNHDVAGDDPSGERRLCALVRRDQLDAARRSVLRALAINVVLGLVCLAVAVRADEALAGWIWFSASTLINLLRAWLSRAPCPGLDPHAAVAPEEAGAAIERRLHLCALAALLSGLVWAALPVLCAGYTSSLTVFYLTITCGITAGAVSHGASFKRIPISFVVPPLLSAAGCLVATGEFDRACLAGTVILYLAALVRTCFESEAAFRRASGLKNEAKALAYEMADRATRDTLTGLLNRAGFTERAERSPAPCLMLLDLDGFKSVNDIYGHKTGDAVLAEVGRRLRARVPAEDALGRLGGDEFAVLYDPDAAGVAYPDLAQSLIAAIAEPFDRFDAGRLGISIGIHLGAEESLTERLVRADEALYAAKTGGRNRFRLFDESLSARLDMRRDAERDLPRALAEGGLDVWFQPIFRIEGRALAGLEALVRWHHPRHGWVPPSDLIAAAAMTGLSEPLFRFILDRVCRMRLVLRAEGMGGVRVAVNVSPRELAQAPIDEVVLETLRTFGLPADGLEIELTEESALDNTAVHEKLAALSRAGISIAVDDFGVGYSSLSRLRQLRVNRVKIDRSLVTGLSEADDKRGLVQAVIGLGGALSLEVVAEGVETQADLAALEELGCSLVQGYLLGRPMSHEDAMAALFEPVRRVA